MAKLTKARKEELKKEIVEVLVDDLNGGMLYDMDYTDEENEYVDVIVNKLLYTIRHMEL